MNNRRDEMINFLKSQKPIVQVIEKFNKQEPSSDLEMIRFKENFEDLPFVRFGNLSYSSSNNTGVDKMNEFLQSQKPSIIIKQTNMLTGVNSVENFTEEILIAPLNTDIRFSSKLPEHVISDYHTVLNSNPYKFGDVKDSKSYRPREFDYNHRHKKHKHGIYVHDEIQENFSWGITVDEDTDLDKIKKSLIHEVTSQQACGSCWFPYFNLNNSLFFIIKIIMMNNELQN